MLDALKNLTLAQWGFLSQIVLTFITLLGILTSMWLSIKALREVQTDRKLRQRPFLAFQRGGHKVQIEFKVAGKSVPGINPRYVATVVPDMPPKAETVRLKQETTKDGRLHVHFYSHLKNYGLGPAISTAVTWIPFEIWVGSDQFSIDEKKLAEPIYGKSMNRLPAASSHILPGEESQLTRLPTFIVLDYEKKIKRVDGILEIACNDVFAQRQLSYQVFHIFTDYTDQSPHLIVTFSDLVDSQDRKHLENAT